MIPLAQRTKDIKPFEVMRVLARARELEAQGRSIIHMEIGEPDFPTPQPIIKAGIKALEMGYTHYTPALGLPQLRETIAGHYPEEAGVSADRVIVTSGASAALQLLMAVLVNPGDEMLMADPGYPCNRHFVRLYEGRPVSIAVDEHSAYQLTAKLVESHWSGKTIGVLMASPSNPTGAVVTDSEMGKIVELVKSRNGALIVDEIYHGLVYDKPIKSVLCFWDRAFVVNSFSKYYGMTGWRLGWTVAPPDYVPVIDKLAQNLFIAAPTVAQHAALRAFDPEVQRELQARRDQFRQRRDYLVPALKGLGFKITLVPQGAFYVYADCSALVSTVAPDSGQLAEQLLEQAGVAITPGGDFGHHRASQYLRFSYANTLENLEEGVSRIANFLK